MRALFLAALLPLVSALRLPPPEGTGTFSRKPIALPPAPARDVAAEAAAAASLLRKDVLPLSGTQEEHGARPLLMVAVRQQHAYAQLVCEVIQTITTGTRAGTTWCKPLALRRADNVAIAMAAEKYDPVLGWLSTDVGGGSVHLFTAAPPAAFVPTDRLSELPPELGIAVRSLVEAHAAQADEAMCVADAAAASMPQQGDFTALREFMALLAQEERDEPTDGFYDPLADM